MTAYVMIRVTVDDPVKLQAYQQVAPAIIEKYHGTILARGGEVVTLEGAEEKRRIVMIAFPDLQAAKAFYHSEEYTQAIALRRGAADFEVIAVQGV